MSPWIFTVIEHIRRQNIIRTSVTHCGTGNKIRDILIVWRRAEYNMAVLCNKYCTFALCTTLCSYHPLTSTVINYLKTHVNMEYIGFFCKKKKSVVEEGESKTKFFLVTNT